MTEEDNSLRKSRQQFHAGVIIANDSGGTFAWSRPLPSLLHGRDGKRETGCVGFVNICYQYVTCTPYWCCSDWMNKSKCKSSETNLKPNSRKMFVTMIMTDSKSNSSWHFHELTHHGSVLKCFIMAPWWSDASWHHDEVMHHGSVMKWFIMLSL